MRPEDRNTAEQNRRWAALDASVPCAHIIPGTCDYCATECPECGSPLRWNKYGGRWDCSNYGACENAGG